MRKAFMWVVPALMLVPAAAPAQDGGPDATGCHMNRKTGDSHCAPAAPRGRAAAQPMMLLDSAAPAGPFRSCAAARQAGAAPLRAGDPGYSRHLDREGDGIGCE